MEPAGLVALITLLWLAALLLAYARTVHRNAIAARPFRELAALYAGKVLLDPTATRGAVSAATTIVELAYSNTALRAAVSASRRPSLSAAEFRTLMGQNIEDVTLAIDHLIVAAILGFPSKGASVRTLLGDQSRLRASVALASREVPDTTTLAAFHWLDEAAEGLSKQPEVRPYLATLRGNLLETSAPA